MCERAALRLYLKATGSEAEEAVGVHLRGANGLTPGAAERADVVEALGVACGAGHHGRGARRAWRVRADQGVVRAARKLADKAAVVGGDRVAPVRDALRGRVRGYNWDGLWRRGAIDTAVLESLAARGAGADETVVAERLDSRVADHLVLAAGDFLTLRSIVGRRVAVLTHVAGLRSHGGWNHKGGAALADVVLARGAGRATQLGLKECVARLRGLSSDRRR